MTSIADEDMAVVVRVAPLVSIDVVIRDALGRVLGVYGGMNENFVLVAVRSRWQADGV